MMRQLKIMSKNLRLTILKVFLVILFLFLLSKFSLRGVSNHNDSFYDTNGDCDRLFHGDVQEQNISINRKRRSHALTEDYYGNITNCATFIQDRGYLVAPASQEELDFPLAFTIVAHGDIFQVERLLRAIYRSHNIYCIHMDLKVPPRLFEAVKKIASCFPNVLLASKRFSVVWGRLSLLEADFRCIKDVAQTNHSFKYLLNLASQDFPLKTNLELVRILKVYNGANEVPATVRNTAMKDRMPKDKPPFELRYATGSLYMTASRGFINYIIHAPRAQKLFDFLQEHDSSDSFIVPDETFYATLNYNPKSLPAPGASLEDPDADPIQIPLTRLKVYGQKGTDSENCLSELFVNFVCVFGVKDLPNIVHKPHLFVTKLNSKFQPDTLTCLEKRLRQRTLNNIATGEVNGINFDFYRNRLFVKKHL